MTKHPSLTALKSFEAAARLGSFSRAADALNVSQSAISHQVRLLEDWFGLELFTRNGRRIDITEHGDELAVTLGQAFNDITLACQRLNNAHNKTLTLTIAAIPSIAVGWLIPRLNQFWAAHPGIAVQLSYALHDSVVDFSTTDIAIRYGTGPWPGAQVSQFLSGAAAPVCAPQLAVNKQAFKHGVLLHDSDRGGWQRWFAANDEAAPASDNDPIFQDFNLLHAAVLAGHGIALAPLDLLADDLAAGRLVQLSERTIHDDHNYVILEPDRPRLAPAVAQFRNWLLGCQ